LNDTSRNPDMPDTRHFRAEVRDNTPLNESHYLLTFRPLQKSSEPLPGQFFMVGADGSKDPLLKRPFCCFRKIDSGGQLFQILYRVKGKGTALMKEMKTGDTFDALGPLGNHWPMPPKKHTPLIVAGGMGIASAFSLAEKLKGKAVILYGARKSDELLMTDELRPLANELHLSTDDGSIGTKGTVLEALKAFLSDHPGQYLLYACGPKGMLRAVSRTALERGLKGYVSVEENMACGVGACLGCAVKTAKGYMRVCKEGPVFRMEEVII
jgi:dihydroorotate dehydrogenase electron transfer subunit